ncbi:MAG TPA: YitT family protein [Mucilaginibacter sp.]|nr:YitT family protein [Mucilaginibacter sp.]
MAANHNSAIASIKDAAYVIAGILICGFALKSFLVPNAFFDGGVTGISLLIHELYHINIAYVIISANIPFIIMGIFQVNSRFAWKTMAAIIGVGICLQFINYPVVTSDKLLVSIFGGVFMGTGVGLAIRGGCALDGIEVLALYTLKRSSFTISEIILGINIIIFSVAAIKLGLPTALYSIMTYYAASRTITFVIEGLEEYTGFTIISGRSEEIKRKLVLELGRGITVYKGERGFLKDSFEVSHPVDIIFTIVTRLEVRRLKNIVYEIDPKAFMFTGTIKEATGGVLKKHASRQH